MSTTNEAPGSKGSDEPDAPAQKSAGASAINPGQRRSVLLRLDPAVHDAMAKWASDELRSVNAQIEITLRRALLETDRAPRNIQPIRKPGRPRKAESKHKPGDGISLGQ